MDNFKKINELEPNDASDKLDETNKENSNKTKNKKISGDKTYDKKEKNKTNKKRNKRTKDRNKRKRRRKVNKKRVIILIIASIVIMASISVCIIYRNNEQRKLEKQEELKKEITSRYNEYVITEKEADIYKLENNTYVKSGKIGKNQELTLTETDITYENEYLEISSLDKPYYIYYKDITKIDSLTEVTVSATRYKKYIVFNSNIVTNEVTNFYDETNNLIYTFNESFNLPIIIKKENIYGVEYNNQLLYVKQEDVKEIIEAENTNKKNTTGISVMNYHFFNNSDDPSDSCNQIICLSTNNLKKHLDYIKENNIFTPTMKELEMYIDGYIRLPESVVLTIDDGWRAKIGSEVISEYGLNATIFLMSKYYDPRNYQNEYIEVHSHGYDIHNGGLCPGGQGGEIKCMEKTKLLEDLNASRDKLNNTTYFCYPFYEYNDYSIEVLKEAGFTMAFGGYGEAGNYKVKPGINKFKLPRYVIYNYTTASNLASYIN